MAQHNAIKFFEAKKVRTVWDDIEEKCYFSIVDVVAVCCMPIQLRLRSIEKRKDIRGNVFSFCSCFGRKSNKYLR